MSRSASAPGLRGRFRLGTFVVDAERNLITGPSGSESLQPKIIDVLCVLAEQPGQVIGRNELIDRVWGVEHGGDESLTRAISHLRRSLGDTRGEPTHIETIPKRGYRLIVPVAPAAPREPEEIGHRPWWRRPLAVGTAVLVAAAAVLTYFFLAGDEPPVHAARTGIVVRVDPFVTDTQTFPSVDFGRALSTEIARSPLIRVRTGANANPSPADLSYTLRGSARRVGEALRVDVQLVDAASGEVVWGQEYLRTGAPDDEAQMWFALAISRDMQLPLLRSAKARLSGRPLMELVPWQLSLLVTWIPGDEVRPAGPPVEDSYWLQRRALEIDPDFAPAHALFAQLASYHALFDPPSDSPRAHARARHHAQRALELAPYDSEVLYQLALYHRNAGQRGRAIALLERVLELQPSHPLAGVDLIHVQGQCSPAAADSIRRLRVLERELSPNNPVRWVALGHVASLHLSRGEFGAAREASLRARRIVPVTWTALPLAAADAELGLREEAAAVLEEHRREWPRLDPQHFATRVVPRWCLNGPSTRAVQGSFLRLAGMIGAPD